MQSLAGFVCLISLSLVSCGGSENAAPPAVGAGLSITSLAPNTTLPGAGFQVQPDGLSALSVQGSGFERGASVVANGGKLKTTFGTSGWLTATFPAELYAREGTVTVHVVNPDGSESNRTEFTVIK